MTRRQVERISSMAEQLSMAAMVGSVADLVLTGARPWWDGAGLSVGLALAGMSLYLTGKMGGPKL